VRPLRTDLIDWSFQIWTEWHGYKSDVSEGAVSGGTRMFSENTQSRNYALFIVCEEVSLTRQLWNPMMWRVGNANNLEPCDRRPRCEGVQLAGRKRGCRWILPCITPPVVCGLVLDTRVWRRSRILSAMSAFRIPNSTTGMSANSSSPRSPSRNCLIIGAGGSVVLVVDAIRYKPEGRGFEMWRFF
jgi:hypothetical protein